MNQPFMGHITKRSLYVQAEEGRSSLLILRLNGVHLLCTELYSWNCGSVQPNLIFSSERSLFSSAAFDIRLAMSFSRSFTIGLKSAMGRYTFAVSYLSFCSFARPWWLTL